MERIKPEDVVAAYKETGVRPKARVSMIKYENNMAYCCGAGVIAYKEIGLQMAKLGAAMKCLTKKYTKNYIHGFTYGFDDQDMWYLKTLMENEEFSAGYEDGKAAAKLVFGE